MPWWRLRRSQQSLLPRVFGAIRSSRPLLTFVGSLLVGVAILDPRWSSETIELPFRGRNVVVLLDASRSMRCQCRLRSAGQARALRIGRAGSVSATFGRAPLAGRRREAPSHAAPSVVPWAMPRCFRLSRVHSRHADALVVGL